MSRSASVHICLVRDAPGQPQLPDVLDRDYVGEGAQLGLVEGALGPEGDLHLLVLHIREAEDEG